MSAAGKAFYNGGFENPMTRREASLIMEIPYVGFTSPFTSPLTDDD